MGQHKPAGLYKRQGIWQIDKVIRGRRLSESTGESNLDRAIAYLNKRVLDFTSDRPKITFQKAATRYLSESKKKSIKCDIIHLDHLMPYIGHLDIKQVHNETLKPFITDRLKQGRKQKTVNLALQIVRRILNLAARSWRLHNDLTWLESAPLITMLPVTDASKPYPLDWDEQDRLFKFLPSNLAEMALYKVNTGCREQEVCKLRWDWEWQTDSELQGRVFLIPESFTKNGEGRLVILNDIAKSVVDRQRGNGLETVFQPIRQMSLCQWRNAWRDAELPTEGYVCGVHNLRHTFGRRLRAAGVGVETRKVLLGHKNGDITSHYSMPEIHELLNAVQKLCSSRKSPALTLVKLKTGT